MNEFNKVRYLARMSGFDACKRHGRAGVRRLRAMGSSGAMALLLFVNLQGVRKYYYLDALTEYWHSQSQRNAMHTINRVCNTLTANVP